MVLKHSWAAPSSTRYTHLAPTQLLSYTEVTQYYPDCRLIYLPPSCSLAILQSSNSGRDTAQASTSRGAAPAITLTRCSDQDAASAISWKFRQEPKTRCGYFSLLRHSIRPLRSPDYSGRSTHSSAQLFPANHAYIAKVRLSPQQYMRKHSQL